MPIRFKMAGKIYDGFLVQFREGHLCPLLVGVGLQFITVRFDQVIGDVDSENLSRLNPDKKEKSLRLNMVGEQIDTSSAKDECTLF